MRPGTEASWHLWDLVLKQKQLLRFDMHFIGQAHSQVIIQQLVQGTAHLVQPHCRVLPSGEFHPKAIDYVIWELHDNNNNNNLYWNQVDNCNLLSCYNDTSNKLPRRTALHCIVEHKALARRPSIQSNITQVLAWSVRLLLSARCPQCRNLINTNRNNKCTTHAYNNIELNLNMINIYKNFITAHHS